MAFSLWRNVGAFATGMIILASVGGCSGSREGASAQSAADTAQNSPAAVSTALKSFFAAATSEEIGGAFPDKATESTFTPVLQKIDPDSPVASIKKAVTDLALLKISDPKTALALTVDESQIHISGQTATVPVSALSVMSGNARISNSDTLAADMTEWAFRNGNWVVTFPAPGSTSSASASPGPSASTK